ncbi:annexin 8 isoform X2 [Wolffia australiana]
MLRACTKRNRDSEIRENYKFEFEEMATNAAVQTVPTPEEDAEILRKACQGWGTDEKAVIDVLANRSAFHRTQIRLAYENLYNEDLVKRLESELSGDFERAIYRWIFEPVERDAIIAYTAAKSKIDYRVIIETACINSPAELLAIKHAYQTRYKRSLEEDVANYFSGDLRQFLLPLVATHKYNGEEVDASLAMAEAGILDSAVKLTPCNVEEMARILSTRSRSQLKATFNRFKDEFGISINKALLNSNLPEDIMSAFRIAIRCIIHPHKYFEKLLRHALSCGDGDAMTRIITTRKEKDLDIVMDLFLHRTGSPLQVSLSRATSGHYRSFLLALLHH